MQYLPGHTAVETAAAASTPPSTAAAAEATPTYNANRTLVRESARIPEAAVALLIPVTGAGAVTAAAEGGTATFQGQINSARLVIGCHQRQ